MLHNYVDFVGGNGLTSTNGHGAWRRRLCAAGALAAILGAAAVARAQPDGTDGAASADDGDGDGDTGPDGGAPVAGGGPASAPTDNDVLVCNGGWRYPLTETREEIGPARFARQLGLQKDLQFTSKAFAFCAGAAAQKYAGPLAAARGPCNGLVFLADRVDIAASNLFRLDDKTSCECLTRPVDSSGTCEGLREQLTTLRRYDDILVDRAELVLATEVCSSPERNTNGELRGACGALGKAIQANWTKGGGAPGQFTLSAPLPASVARGVRRVRKVTDGRYLSVMPENFIGVRESLCKLPIQPVVQNQCTTRVIEPPPDAPKGIDPAGARAISHKMAEATWSMCNELALSDVNATTCRDADVYIDERGQLHLNRPLTTRKQRKNATLCIDISDFDESHPLMVTLGLDPTGSVPKRVWPGETMRIGDLIDAPVTSQDVLHINVLGKARGVSLTEVLRVNGIPRDQVQTATEDSCRIARSWVPVVDHEVPIGDPRHQAVIPLEFNRGRDGETRPIKEGDYVVMWVRDIEPAGGVLVEYADGQRVGYEPPPLLGLSPRPGQPGGILGQLDVGARLRGGHLGVDAPLLPRRARYPGSRVLRLGSPAGSSSYKLRVCRPAQATATGDNESAASIGCSGAGSDLLLDEKMFVHGKSHFGVKFYFGYSWFPISQYEARRTPAAIEQGGNTHEIVRTTGGLADYDVATTLAIYPFGRDPRQFSGRPWTARYWSQASLLVGFSIRSLTPWDDFYGGITLPLANGVDATLMGHFSRRRMVTGVEEGQLIEGSDLSVFPKDTVVAVGASVGISLDFDLFERAFVDVWDRISGRQHTQFFATSNTVVPSEPSYSEGY